MVFTGLPNFSIFAAQHKGLFGKHGLAVELVNTPSSDAMRDGLAKGDVQIAHAGVDNAVAMAELVKADVAIVTGGDNGFNRIIVQSEIKSYADLRGKTVVVDAPDTAFAFQLYQMLKLHGVGQNEIVLKPVGATRFRLQAITTDKSIAASMLNLPFSLLAEQAGIKKLATAVDVIGPYLSTTGFVLRPWARDNGDTLVRYAQAYVEGLRWAMDPSNKAEAIALLAKGLDISDDIASRSYVVAADPKNGFMRDAKVDLEGFKNVLKLRAELHGDWGGKPPAPEPYLDLSHYQRALAGL
jgi:ABC-type nitrate/sulfonate/bicarbonate transport system substrate-binding protein